MTQRGPVAYQNAAINKRAAQIGALVLVCFAAGVTIFFGKWAAVGAIFVGAVGVAIGWWAKQGKSVAPDYAGDESGGMAASTQLIGVIEVLDVPAFILDDEGSVVAHNRLVRELFPRIATSKPLSHVSRNPDLLRAIDEASAERKVRTLQIVDRVTQGRRLFASVSPLQSTNEQKNGGSWPIRRFLLIQFRDLTEQDRLAQMRSDFIANASHELRTPLAAMKGFIETLRGPARDDAVSREKFLGIMDAQAARMARILDDLLFLSRVEMRAHIAPEDDVELGTVLRTVLQGLAPIADDAKIILNLDAGSEAWHTRGDRDQLEQVFQNLVQNAIKYGREGGKVDVAVKLMSSPANANRRIAVSVTDDGPGIAEEHLPRLTERFYRVDTATSRARGGTGLGLAIVKHILNRHRGELEIESKLGEGSKFTVVLEALPSPNPAADTLAGSTGKLQLT